MVECGRIGGCITPEDDLPELRCEGRDGKGCSVTLHQRCFNQDNHLPDFDEGQPCYDGALCALMLQPRAPPAAATAAPSAASNSAPRSIAAAAAATTPPR